MPGGPTLPTFPRRPRLPRAPGGPVFFNCLFFFICHGFFSFAYDGQVIVLGAFGGRKQNHDHDNLYNHDHPHYLEDIHIHRELADLELQVLADPAEQQVLLLSQAPQDPAVLNRDRVSAALDRVGLNGRVVADRSRWQQLEAVVAIPWEG